ncbi:MAG: substrate-binding periplasmic protein [Spirochaetota bacterium]
MHKKTGIVLVMLAMISAAVPAVLLTAEVPSADIQPLYILAENEAGPWGQPDGSGCGNDIVTAAYKAAGASVILDVVPYNRAKKLLLSGKALGCFGMAWDPAFEKKVVFADQPLYSNSAVIFLRKTERIPFSHIDDFPKGTRVGTVLGYEYPAAIRKLIRTGQICPVPAASEQINLRILASGRLDAVICMVDELKSPDYLMTQAGVTGAVCTAFVADRSGTYIGFAVSHPQREYALKMFNKGMAVIKRNGTYDRIIRTWIKKIAEEQSKSR